MLPQAVAGVLTLDPATGKAEDGWIMTCERGQLGSMPACVQMLAATARASVQDPPELTFLGDAVKIMDSRDRSGMHMPVYARNMFVNVTAPAIGRQNGTSWDARGGARRSPVVVGRVIDGAYLSGQEQ